MMAWVWSKFLSGAFAFVILTYLCPARCDSSCGAGWKQKDEFCYFFSEINDTRSMREAAHQCYIRDAQLAIPESPEELHFLQDIVKDSFGYGWMINVFIRSYDNDPNYYDFINNEYISYTPNEGSIPELVPDYDPEDDTTDMCIAFHAGDIYYSIDAWFSVVWCQIRLHVACQADQDSFSNQDIDNLSWFSKNGNIFWVSDQLANYDDALQICKDKGMSLVDNVDGHSTDFLSAIKNPIDAVPFWSAATFVSKTPQWPDGSAVKDKDIPWGVHKRSKSIVVLMQNGYGHMFYMDHRWRDQKAFPYICKKYLTPKGQFDCPDMWKRAGRSCYSTAFSVTVTWNEAKDACDKQGSHLLKIDSIDELTWLSTVFAKDLFSTGTGYDHFFWTGANDLTTDDSFTWVDGSEVDKSLFPIQTYTYSGLESKRCSYVSLFGNYYYPDSCTEHRHYPACQYKLERGETDCAPNWKKYDDNCYYLDDETAAVVYELNIPTCVANLAGSGVQTYKVKPLQVQTDAVFTFLINDFNKGFYWLGLEAKDKAGTFTWLDGSTEDVYQRFNAFLKDSKDTDDYDAPKHCAGADPLFQAIKMSCEDKNIYVCEKEIASTRGTAARGVSKINYYLILFIACVLRIMLEQLALI